jgi:uncharacterized protein
MGNERGEGELKTKLIIMAKPPVLGLVKTRLAATIGDKQALKTYRELLDLTFSVAHESALETVVHFSEQAPFTSDFSLFVKDIQEGDGLGERILKSFSKELQDADGCIMIGADCPDLTADILQQAEQALEENDIVLGPSDDGGYYLIALKEVDPALFAQIAWSTETVLQSTVDNAEKLGKKVALLCTLFDIDDIDDLKRSRFSAMVSESRNFVNSKEN